MRFSSSPLPPTFRWRGVGGGGRFNGSNNDLKNAVNIRQHIVIPKSQHAIAIVFQIRRSNFIRCAFGMLATIDFKNKTSRMTREVRKECPNRSLPTEMSIRKMTKTLPKFAFGIGRRFTHVTRAFDTTIRFTNC